jgi:hypothetical protein
MESLKLYVRVIKVYVMPFVCTFGIVGNVLSMVVLGVDRSLRPSAPRLLLQMLAVADTAMLVASLFFVTLSHVIWNSDWLPVDTRLYDWYYMVLINPLYFTAQTASVYMVVVVTTDRYVAVCHPLQAAHYSTVRRARVAVVAVWVAAVLFNLPRWFQYHFEFYKYNLYSLVYTVSIYIIVNFIVPLALLVYFNYRLIRAIRESRRSVQDHSQTPHDGKSAEEQRYTLTVVVIITVFIACLLPRVVRFIWWSVCEYGGVDCSHYRYYIWYIVSTADLLFAVNSSVNVVIYCFTGRRFRESLVRVICCRRQVHQ